MKDNDFIVDGRRFRTQADYNRALHDKAIIDQLRKEAKGLQLKQLEQLKSDLQADKYSFFTMLGQDFMEEVEELIAKKKNTSSAPKKLQKTKEFRNTKKLSKEEEDRLNAIALQELNKQERRRKKLMWLFGLIAIICLGYFSIRSYYDYRTDSSNEQLSDLKDKPLLGQANFNENETVHVNLDPQQEPKEVLDEYKNLLIKNKKLIGWLKIDDTNIDYPVMQTTDNSYYQNHNINQEYDKNGSIFLDKDCDVLKPSTNYILYGHHMKSGQMFGDLDKYSSEEYGSKHKYIEFDTIYEKGLYQVMYVFRSRVYSEEEIVFKYYQFIDALSKQEFDSYMQEMSEMSLYDTGITAEYGDQLLTLSTCDYQEKNGRFVVVAKRINAKE